MSNLSAPTVLTRTRGHVTAAALLLAGAVLLAASTGRHLHPLFAWLAPILVLRYVRTLPSLPALALAAAVYALAFVAGWWNVFFTGGIQFAIVGSLGVMMFVPYLADRLLYRRLDTRIAWAAFPLAWASLEYVYSLAGPYGTWGCIAYSQWGELHLLQLLSITGLWGFPLLIGAVASLINVAWERGFAKPTAWRPLIGAMALMAAVLGFGSLRLALHRPATTTVRVTAISADNIDAFESLWAPLKQEQGLTVQGAVTAQAKSQALLNQLFAASAKAATSGARVILWSEANAMVLRTDQTTVQRRAASFAARHHVYLLATMAILAPGRPLAANIAALFGPRGQLLGSYQKHHPAPGERSAIGRGNMPLVTTPWGRLSWAICYDFDFPAWLHGVEHQGVSLLLNPAWDSPSIDPLHAHMAMFRAIESGASEVRSTEDGMSLAVDGLGHTLTHQVALASPSGVQEMDVAIPVRDVFTLYDHVGDAFAWAALAGLAVVALLASQSRYARPLH